MHNVVVCTLFIFIIIGFTLTLHHSQGRAETTYDFQTEVSRDAYIEHLTDAGFLNLDGSSSSSIDGIIINPFQDDI